MTFSNIAIKIKSFMVESKRVFLITKKPTMQEYKIIIKVSAIGMLIIGFIGFIVTVVSQLGF